MRKAIVVLLFAALSAGSVRAAGVLVDKSLLSDRIDVRLPSHMIPLEEEIRIFKFPYLEDDRCEVWADYDGECTFVFQFVDRSPDIDMPALLKSSLADLENTGVVDVLNSEIQTINEREFLVIEFQSRALDTTVYNLITGAIVGDELLFCSFSCPTPMQTEWSAIGREVLDSVQVVESSDAQSN